MAAGHDLKGLMKFLGRDEWHDCFDDVFDEHFGAVLEAADVDFEDLADMLGDDVASTLWGCAFEDFLTRNFEVEGHNIVDEYLRRRGWKESTPTKAYMKALRSSVMSLYDRVPGRGVEAAAPGQG